MNSLTDGGKGSRLTLAFFLALTMSWGGLCYGAGQSGREQGTDRQAAPSVKSSGSDASAGIQPGTWLAAKIEKKSRVQVITTAGTTEIRYPLIVPGGITSQGAASPIPWSEVRKIRFQGRATMTGMWIGFGVGAAISTAASIAAAGEEDFYWWVYPLFIGATSALGAGSGAIIGTMFPKWKTLYDAPSGPPMVARVSLAPMRRGGAMTLTLAF